MTSHPEPTPELTSEDLRLFGVDAQPERLPGGSAEVWKVGNVVLKHISETSLENDHSPELAVWIAEFSATLPQRGFRIPQGVPGCDGLWITPDGWTAWTFVDGKHASRNDIPQCIAAIDQFHQALKSIPRHPLLDDSRTHWSKAQKWCLAERPLYIHPIVKGYVDTLYELRKPVKAAPYQLTHGDLNPENILIAEGLPPAFIDFSPFWGPPGLAMAIFANWIGPRQGDATVLGCFNDVPDFEQMLVRAAIRMLLVMSDGGNFDGWETCSEKGATEIVIDFVDRVD